MRTPSGAAEHVAATFASGALTILAGCRSPTTDGHRADASVTTPIASIDASPSPEARTARPASSRPCTVTTSTGAALPDEDPSGWLVLSAERPIAVREHASGRELSFQGPGRALPCARGVTLLGRGSVSGRPFAGEAPGSEQWVATACGVLRWASGAKHVTADVLGGAGDRCTFDIGAGTASWYLPADVVATDDDARAAEATPTFHTATGKRSIGIVPRTRTPGYFTSAAGSRHALDACVQRSGEVQDIARALMGGVAPGGVPGDLAARSVAARGLARAACAVAEVRVALSGGKPADRARLDGAVAAFRDDAAPAENPAGAAGNRE